MFSEFRSHDLGLCNIPSVVVYWRRRRRHSSIFGSSPKSLQYRKTASLSFSVAVDERLRRNKFVPGSSLFFTNAVSLWQYKADLEIAFIYIIIMCNKTTSPNLHIATHINWSPSSQTVDFGNNSLEIKLIACQKFSSLSVDRSVLLIVLSYPPNW